MSHRTGTFIIGSVQNIYLYFFNFKCAYICSQLGKVGKIKHLHFQYKLCHYQLYHGTFLKIKGKKWLGELF